MGVASGDRGRRLDPDARTIADAKVTRFLAWLRETGRGDFADYPQLLAESVRDVEWFWGAIWRFFDVQAASPPDSVLGERTMPGAEWFPGATLNYVTQVFRNATEDRPALVVAGEDGSVEWSWAQLQGETAAFASYLQKLGVRPGDRVVGYLPNIGEAVVAFLAAASVGAVWALCNQDLAPSGVVARFGQLEPTVLVASDGSVYGGKRQDRREQLAQIRRRLPTLRATVVVPRLGALTSDTDPDLVPWASTLTPDADPVITPVSFAHPLWVLFSSGTTGTPKGIVHGHGGVLLEHLKCLSLHLDLAPRDRFLWQSSTSWMMWNLLVSGLLVGATVVLYDGSPTYPRTDSMWQVVADHDVTVFGAGAGYLLACAKEQSDPDARGADYDLTTLHAVGSTGSPLPASGFRWVQERVGRRIPVGFWNDSDRSRYRKAYFDKYGDGVWCHGDWITITERGSVVVHGRSDATLNRMGVGMGSAEIYDAVEQLPEVRDCLAVGVELDDGGYWMPLFVDLAGDTEIDDELRARIAAAIRTGASPRHVPDDIVAVPGIPRTMTGKRLEIPIKRILLGAAPGDVVSSSAVDRPELLGVFAQHSRT